MRSASTEIEIVEDLSAVSRKAAQIIVGRIAEALSHKPYFSIALSGGSTPKTLFRLLVDDETFRARIPWNKIHFFWGDERHVPPDHPESNYRMARETMLSRVPVPDVNIHRVRSEAPDAGKAAADYEQELRAFFKLESGQLPCLDCVLLGMGPDGHTASLFAGTAALRETRRLVVASYVEKFRSHRITMTASVFNHAEMIIFMVGGKEKAEVLQAVLEGKPQPDLYPAQLIRPANGKLLWLVERSAATLLSKAD